MPGSAAAIARHCREIERCNQWGGRMLSVVDLLRAGTLSRDVAAYALAAIGSGASFMVGARPGGAGKTTVMGALLNFVPADVELAPAEGMCTWKRLRSGTPVRECLICHEIGPGGYYSYLWGERLRAYFGASEAGRMLATNLHADTLDEAREQVVEDNMVPERRWLAMNLVFLLRIRRGPTGMERVVHEVWETTGATRHRKVFADGSTVATPDLVSAAQVAEADATIAELLRDGRSSIEDVRRAVLERYLHGS